jgi:hypothetical protein
MPVFFPIPALHPRKEVGLFLTFNFGKQDPDERGQN